LESTKEPLENRVWRFYQRQNTAGFLNAGMSTRPSQVARVLDDGSTQLWQYSFDGNNHLSSSTDPLGRSISRVYSGIDLVSVAQANGEQVLSATYNSTHQMLTRTDASNQTTTYTYNNFGQPLTVTDPTGRTSTMVYDNQGYLQESDGFDPAIKSTFTYDGFGRLASTTSYPDGYTVALAYDATNGNPLATLNRPTTVTYPDGSYTEADYTNLDVEWSRDRGGNWTHRLTNKLRQLVASIDPLGQITQFGFCLCGKLVRIVDPNGNVTQWKLDDAERPISKVYADNTEVDYTYGNTNSRLLQVTDAKGQTTNYQYNLDGATAGVTYGGTAPATPSVSYTYDALRGRLATMVDGIGTTTYSYFHIAGGTATTGAGRLQSTSGPFQNETVGYQYDALGRLTTRTVDGVAETYAFDSLGRLQTDTNALGTFNYGYDGVTNRLASVGYPNGQQALYSYLEDNTQDRRMSQIKHLTPTSTLLDEFDYTYDGPQPGASVGSMATNDYALRYDAIGQLRQAVLNGDSTNPGSSVWNYDPAGNRIGVQSGSGTLSTAVPTSTNSLFSLNGGGSVFVAGTLSKWANVTVNSQPASLNAAKNSFQAFVPLPTGVQSISISATDVDGNTATNAYHLNISAGAGESFAYDANGNTTSLAPTATGSTPETLEWDAVDRVTAINIGTHRTQFAYDGNGARVRITEMDNGSTTTDRFYVANEERDAASGQVLRIFQTQGEQRISNTASMNYFYARDHLASTRELTDSAGQIQASYAYDLWGGPRKLQGQLDTEIEFTGYWYHNPSGLEISPTRLYLASSGLFVSRDPVQENGGLNLYSYCGNDPANLLDPSGLDAQIYVFRTSRTSVATVYVYENNNYLGNFQAEKNIRSGTEAPSDGVYSVKPKDNFTAGDPFVNGTPSITGNGRPTGSPQSGDNATFRIHPDGTSNGCLTVPLYWADEIWDIMDREIDEGGTQITYQTDPSFTPWVGPTSSITPLGATVHSWPVFQIQGSP
jgi:RHS repeat-associated protein